MIEQSRPDPYFQESSKSPQKQLNWSLASRPRKTLVQVAGNPRQGMTQQKKVNLINRTFFPRHKSARTPHVLPRLRHAAVVVVGQFPGARATRNPTSAAMDLKSMIHEAKSREMGLYAKFQEYDSNGSGFLDEVRVEGRVALWDVPPCVREVHLGGEQRAYARA